MLPNLFHSTGLLRTPSSMPRLGDCVNLDGWNGHNFTYTYILAAAARMRTALVTCSSWRSRLQAHREFLVSY
eukprot:227032-Pyramimonas_sp.AAC.1